MITTVSWSAILYVRSKNEAQKLKRFERHSLSAEKFGMSERSPEVIRNYVQKRMKRNGQL